MREIKFRAWDKNEEWMVCNIQDAYDGLPYSKENAEHIVDSYDWVSGFSSFLASDDFIPMQYTGLKDMNGVEIYEGDVVWCRAGEHRSGIWEYEKRFVVEYGWSQAMWEMSMCEEIEVIGNIYDNPELLEGQE